MTHSTLEALLAIMHYVNSVVHKSTLQYTNNATNQIKCPQKR